MKLAGKIPVLSTKLYTILRKDLGSSPFLNF
jgi:hypothetical protein